MSERRNFIKIGTMGMATALATPAFALNDDSRGKSKGTLEGGSSWLNLDGQLKVGRMTLEARAFEEGKDRAVIIHSTVYSTAAKIDLYSAMYSYDSERTIFAVYRDNDHCT